MKDTEICVIGLGYVGLPLARLFSKKYRTFGFDIKQLLVQKLNDSVEELNAQIKFTDNIKDAVSCNLFIIAVPTPIRSDKKPDLQALKEASALVASVLKKGDIVVYESTVYPGVTEDVCVPILIKESSLRYNTDFFVGYSPERINPGDKEHSVESVKKLISASTIEAIDKIDAIYSSVITAGTYRTSSIKVAEAAKVFENTQRDVNIALVNEFAQMLNKSGINTKEVLDAASTKWNFLPFQPGLVGGHCIGIDPYYLIEFAEKLSCQARLLIQSRQINEDMSSYIVNQIIELMRQKEIDIANANILILGFTFKENWGDINNTKVFDIYKRLKSYSPHIDIYDPLVDPKELTRQYKLSTLKSLPKDKSFDAIILTVAHEVFKTINLDKLKKENSVVYDVKSFFDKEFVDAHL